MPSFQLPFNKSRPPEEQGRKSFEGIDFTPPPGAELHMSSPKANQYSRLLTWLGIDNAEINDELVGMCPFLPCPAHLAQKSDKFTMNKQSGKWRCFVCGQTGNTYSLAKAVHLQWLEQTSDLHYAELHALRKRAIDICDFKTMQVALNQHTKEWMIPAFGIDGNLINLFFWKTQYDERTGVPSRQLMASPSMNQVAYGLNMLRNGANRKLFIVEGHWDYMALYGLLRRLNKLQEYDILATSGNTIPKRFLSYLASRDIIFLLDNDPAGVAGVESMTKTMANIGVMPLSIRKMKWPAFLPQGFDLSDIITSLPPELRKKKE